MTSTTVEKAPVVAATGARIDLLPKSSTAVGTVVDSLRPFARRRAAVTVMRATLAGLLLFGATGLAEWHPCLALLLTLLALATAPIWGTTGVSCNTSMPGAPTRTPCFSTGHPSLTADSSATGYHGRPEAMNTNRLNGGEQ